LVDYCKRLFRCRVFLLLEGFLSFDVAPYPHAAHALFLI
jgi:hypothetical protein